MITLRCDSIKKLADVMALTFIGRTYIIENAVLYDTLWSSRKVIIESPTLKLYINEIIHTHSVSIKGDIYCYHVKEVKHASANSF